MRVLRLVVFAALACFSACADDPTVCSGSEPTRLLAPEAFPYVNQLPVRAGDYTFMRAVNARGYQELLAGPGCGAEAVSIVEGILLAPFRYHDDPRDDDPTIACDTIGGHFFRVDPLGDSAPTLMLPELRCTAAATTEHGLLVVGNHDRALWLLPDFPRTDTARIVSDQLDLRATGLPIPIVDDTLWYLAADRTLHRQDLVTGADTHVLDQVAAFDVDRTHVLWREQTGAPVAPMHLLDLASGTSSYLGLYHEDEDQRFGVEPRRDRLWRDAWTLSRGGSFVLHIPTAADVPMQAFDLEGRAAAFPPLGAPLHFLADGTVLLTADDALLAARPGSAPIILDAPGDALLPRDPPPDPPALELLVGSELRLVPLDGSPSRLIAREVGERWTWLDEQHILTIRRHTLTTIQPTTGRRQDIAAHVFDFSIAPDGGVHYIVAYQPGYLDSGLWYAPDAALRPPPTKCVNLRVCE
ncbi:MAG TPA: hypothetical protein VGB85_05395 [Nannocystis sp.]